MRYADPASCPDCRSALPHAVPTCPSCGLQVRHPLATELFATLQRADQLLLRLQQVSQQASQQVSRQGPVPAFPRPVAPQPAAAPPAPRTGVAWASVPKILLGLGAFFLLVAAVVFLAVSWSQLGVGGRTAVLLALTGLAGGTALLLHRYGLRIAGEALIVVALGLLALDVVGAGNAGWFGDLSGGTIALAAGVALLLGGTATGLVRVAGRPRLVAPQVVAGIGLFTAYCGAVDALGHPLLTSHGVVVLGAAGALAARRTVLPVLAASLGAAAAVAWAFGGLVAVGVALDRSAVAALWLDSGAGWSMLATAAAALLPGVVLHRRTLLDAGGSVAALVVTAALSLPCVDAGAGTVGLVALLVTLGWVLAIALVPAMLRPVAVAPTLAGGLLLGGLLLLTSDAALDRWFEVVSSDRSQAAGRFTGPDPVAEPLLAVPSALVVLAVVLLVVPGLRDRAREAWPVTATVAAVVAGVSAAVTVASYDVPVAAAVAVLLVTAVVAVTASLALAGTAEVGVAALGASVGGAAVVLGLPWAGLTVATSAAAVLAAGALHLRAASTPLRRTAGVGLTPALGLLVWSLVAVADLGAAWAGVPLLLVLGVLAIGRPRPEVEVPAAVVGVLGAVVAVDAATDTAGALALHLTVLGFLVSATALVHETRRPAAWAGGALLLLASWVRLGDLGVVEPEAYTLPLAVVLTVLGVLRLRRDPDAPTATALGPGLVLATLPSLVWVLDDPASLRAVLLGLGAVLMTVAGATLRWSAPLVVGAAVGAAVALRELGPYAGDAPAWVWIGLGGVLLVVVGITWERRLVELRTAAGLLSRLR